MQKITLPLFFYFFLFKSISGADDCLPASCSPTEPEVRFPFRIRGRQPSHCGFSGFDLSCNEQNRTILHLTPSTSYIVNAISYSAQVIYIDSEFCRQKGIDDFLQTSPILFGIFTSWQRYQFYNCSLQRSDDYVFQAVTLPCLDDENHSVIAVRSWFLGETPENCQDIPLIFVPIRMSGNLWKELGLKWFTPDCIACEVRGGTCSLENANGDTTCFVPPDVIRREKKEFHTFVGVLITLLVLFPICICCRFACKCIKESDYNRRTHQNGHMLPVTSLPTTGLELPTIESYKKTVLGESLRLPRNDDGCCAICLLNYKPRDALRTLPECDHYFHADCIDGWLKLNATCPMYRHLQKS